MPRGDGTGPAGLGPMTGRAAGFCAGYSMPGHTNPAGGRSFLGGGRGFSNRGGGRGRRNWFHATGLPGWTRFGYGMPAYGGTPNAPVITAQEELDGLKDQAEYLQESLGGIKKRIEELESQKNT